LKIFHFEGGEKQVVLTRGKGASGHIDPHPPEVDPGLRGVVSGGDGGKIRLGEK
jgi:hypothetical protein